MSDKRVYNFGAGPACLPPQVLEEIRSGFMNFGGISVLEIGHRSKAFENILCETQNLTRELLGIPQNYHVLFLQGGASLQFAMVPMNLMETTADYVLTGRWAKKALEEAKFFGSPVVVFSSEKTGFDRVPLTAEIKTNPNASYLHITSNNTVYGTQYHEFPDAGTIPLVADMTSDILSREIDISRFGLIYASAQKNLGIAGLTLVIVRADLIGRQVRNLPSMLKYSTYIENNSVFNTPPVFAIYVASLVLRWLKKEGGIRSVEKQNRKKAAMLYDVLDKSTFYKTFVERRSRSTMNIVFTLPDKKLTEEFIKEAEKSGMAGLKGHRSVGGIRASIYNAFPITGVLALVQFMKEFERTNS